MWRNIVVFQLLFATKLSDFACGSLRSVARGRPRSNANLHEIARQVARGRPLRTIATEMGCTDTLVRRRLGTMRLELSRNHPDGPIWLDPDARTAVEVAQAYLLHVRESASTGPDE